jgi:hypothetical protein
MPSLLQWLTPHVHEGTSKDAVLLLFEVAIEQAARDSMRAADHDRRLSFLAQAASEGGPLVIEHAPPLARRCPSDSGSRLAVAQAHLEIAHTRDSIDRSLLQLVGKRQDCAYDRARLGNDLAKPRYLARLDVAQGFSAPSFELLLIDREQVDVFTEDRVDAGDGGVIKKVRLIASFLQRFKMLLRVGQTFVDQVGDYRQGAYRLPVGGHATWSLTAHRTGAAPIAKVGVFEEKRSLRERFVTCHDPIVGDRGL